MNRERRSALEWLIVDEDCLLVAALITAAAFALLLGLYVLDVAFVNDDSVTRVASGMIAGTFSLVTLVVSVDQMILSRAFSSAGVMAFRGDSEECTDTPATPPAYRRD